MSGNEELVIRGAPIERVPEVCLGEYLFALCREHGRKPAFIDGVTKKEVSFDELHTTSVKLAVALQRLGLKPGDVVGICANNSIYYPTVILATFYIGCVLAPYNNSYSIGELEHAVSLSKPTIMFCSKRTRPNVIRVFNSITSVRDIVLVEMEDELLTNIARLTRDITASDVRQFQPVKVANVKTQEVMIMCSSGTTGLPKGVLLTHYNVIYSLTIFKEPDMAMPEDLTHIIGFLPPFHVFGLMSIIHFLQRGLATVTLEQFEPTQFLQTIQDYKIRALGVVPPILTFLAKHPLPGKYDLSSLEELGCGAAPISRETELAVMQRFPNIKNVRQGYGMTETTLAVTRCRPDQVKPGSVGPAVPGVEIKVINPETGRPLGPNTPGEVCVRGPLIMKGYIENIAATRECIDPAGWLHTGDIGYYDQEGWFYIVDRLKELIKYKGFQVPPAELEALLMVHPAVLDAAVIGVPDEAAGELPKAFIVKRSPITAKELQDFVAARVSNQKHLRGGVEFIDAIPKNPSGKILRRELRNKTQKPNSKL